MSFIRRIQSRYYVVTKVKRDGVWKDKVRPASKDEVRTYLEAKDQDIAIVVCAHPYCDAKFPVPRIQKLEINTTIPRKRGIFEYFYCSIECREAHLKALGVTTSSEKT